MKHCISIFLILCLVLAGCSTPQEPAQIAATTLPVWEFTSRLCAGTGITVTRLVTESVSCLHDYTLQVGQMRAIEGAELVVISGAGLEEFLEDALRSVETTVDASAGIELICPDYGHDHDHDEHGEHDHGHHHENDPHIWLSPANASIMARNICDGLTAQYPEYAALFQANLTALLADLEALDIYGKTQLADLACHDIITFHDGFAYFAEHFGLHIVRAVEEESGSEASAAELIELIEEVAHHELPAIFIEANGADAAARTISAETGAEIFTLDMAMAGDSYFVAMYRNIDTLKEALE